MKCQGYHWVMEVAMEKASNKILCKVIFTAGKKIFPSNLHVITAANYKNRQDLNSYSCSLPFMPKTNLSVI
jgi:hypothetical protein